LATSGTVGTVIFTTQQVIDLAFRRCRLSPEQIVSQHIDVALRQLSLTLSAWSNKLLALWAIDRPLVAMYEAQSDYYLPAGTLDIMNAQLRTVHSIPGTLVRHGSGLNNYYQFDFDDVAHVTQVGLTFGANATVDYVIQFSTDLSSYTTRVTVPSRSVSSGETLWYDISNAGVETLSMRVFAGSTSSINLSTVVVGNNPSDIPMSLMDRDTYAALPNKQFLGRPVQYYYDRQRGQPKMVIWPVPSSSYTSTSLISLYTHRQIQDVGTMQQELELPQRWYEAAIAELARKLSAEIKEVDPSLQAPLAAEADRQFRIASDGETDRASVRLLPMLRRYTR